MKLFFSYQVIDYIFIIAGIAAAFFLPENFILAGSAFALLVVAGVSNYLFQRMAGGTKRALGEMISANSATDQIKPGDILIVKEGERIPIDGEVTEGDAYINESFLIKEAERVFKQAGDIVYAGTINEGVPFKIKALRSKGNVLIAQAMLSAEQAQKSKMPFRATTNILSVGAAVIITALAWSVYYLSKDMTKISALFFAFGAGHMAFLSRSSATSLIYSLIPNGIVVNGENMLERLLRVRLLILHKTERLQFSKKGISSVIPFWGADENKVLLLAASAHKYSHDPLARIILEEAKKRNLQYAAPAKFEMIKDRGSKAQMPDGIILLAGDEAFMRFSNIHIQESIIQRIQSEKEQGIEQIVLIAYDNKIIGAISFMDALQVVSKMAVEELRKTTINEVLIVSEENSGNLKKIAEYLGADRCLAWQPVEQQKEIIDKIVREGRQPIFVGDGISDKEILSGSLVGVAVGAMENDFPANTAGIVLFKNKLTLLPLAISEARKLMSVLRVNFLLCLAYHVVIVALILFGIFGAFETLAAHLAFNVILMLNSSRAIRIKN